MDNEERSPEEEGTAEAYQALSVFCSRYDPATEDTATGYFSSQEIQGILTKHIGIEISLHKIYELMIGMKYNYKLQGEQFMWMVKE